MAQTDTLHLDRTTGVATAPKRKTLNLALWVVQVLLGLLFLWAGAMKLVMPMEQMAGPVAFPEWFLRFIGVVEVLGGLGLILPARLRIRPGLTPLAAAGLVIVMIGAVVTTLMGGAEMAKMAAIPAVTGLLCAFVAYGRWRMAPIHPKR